MTAVDVNLVWELSENMALEKYYIETEKGVAEKPALLVIFHKRRYKLLLNLVGLIDEYRSMKQLHDRVKRLVEEEANYPLRLFREKHGKRDKKPYAVNEKYSQLYEDGQPGAYLRAFNIPEWEHLIQQLEKSDL